ncbi:hypothetical protein HF1_01650 [Mycoplasma haemofelis str. Langford 1]|uniref:Uncharacterized protein n=2 Tax=Mycoplasma haemofelis TaxID=29501 RepID=F6FG19_MYCHI|nr:hypothetical protein [Mycoplasma haemofelis]AEG72485.1 hypothetical protein MHF_0186 [Mycoplasma haemofelis Ohio2]CBY92173.1 hypothetical protein HF1_01650 [Mycoplasma haemofelis str. Langford 1]
MDAKLALFSALGASAGGMGAFGAYKLISKEQKAFTDEEYQLIFKEFKSNESFITALKTQKAEITKDSSNSEGGKVTKEWCLKHDSKEAKQWCVILPKTISEKIGKPLSSNWAERVKSITNKSDSALLNDLKSIKSGLSQIADGNQDSQDALKGWCESKWNTKVIDDEGNAIYTKIVNRCVDGQ